MRWQELVIVIFAALAAIFLVDGVLALRFRFAPGSVGRSFLFHPLIQFSVLASPIVVGVAYLLVFRKLSTRRRFLYGMLLIAPMLWWTWLVLFAIAFTSGERA